jgi:hypothetical protein
MYKVRSQHWNEGEHEPGSIPMVARCSRATLSYTAVCVLQLIALLRYDSELDPGWQPWAYVIFVVSIAALGACGLLAPSAR